MSSFTIDVSAMNYYNNGNIPAQHMQQLSYSEFRSIYNAAATYNREDEDFKFHYTTPVCGSNNKNPGFQPLDFSLDSVIEEDYDLGF